jgi:hypothetical protein
MIAPFFKGLWGSLVTFQVWVKEVSRTILSINIESLPEYLTTPVQIRAAPFNIKLNQRKFKMPNKSKKSKSAGRFGARHGRED